MKHPEIETLLFIPTGSYHDMGLRPYTAHANGDTLNALDQATDGFRNLTSGNLAGIAGRILRPSSHTTGSVFIDNGWQEQRFMFMMKVVHPNEYGLSGIEDASERVQYVTGYTDMAGDASYNGLLDPGMRMYINTVINTTEIVRNNMRRRRLVNASRFLQQNAGMGSGSSSNLYALRPRDVVTAVGMRSLGDPDDNSDFRTSLSTRPMFSTIRNEMPSDYMYRTVSAYRLSMNSNRHGLDDEPGIMAEVASNTGDEAGIDDAFVMTLSTSTELAEGSFFSYRELCNLFNGVDQAAQILEPTKMVRDIGFSQHDPRDSQVWTGSNSTTMVATILSSAVPALMVDSMLTQCAFMVSNDTVNGVPVFQWLSAPMSFMLDGEDLSQQMIHFEDQFLKETFRDVTNNNNITVTISAHSDLVMADTRMEISVDGDLPEPFCVPNFASSLITPVIGNDREQLNSMAGSISEIFAEMAPSSLSMPDVSDFGESFIAPGGGSLRSALRDREYSTPQPTGGSSSNKETWRL